MNTECLHTHTPALFQAAVRRVAELLCRGDIVALPTETVYGLAANALDEKAVAKIFQVKGRPANNPIIVHIAGVEMAKGCASNWPAAAEKLARSFWPGPLTLVLPRTTGGVPVTGSKTTASQVGNFSSEDGRNTSPMPIPDIVTAGGPTVAIRWPSHPFIQAVIRACGFPLAAPSANLSGRVSPTNPEHVRRQFGGKIPLIIDGGQSQVGIESTVLDLAVLPPQILRPGMIHAGSLAAVCGEIRCSKSGLPGTGSTLRSPGMLKKHYAPKAKLLVLAWRDDADLKRQLAAHHVLPAACHVIGHRHIPQGQDFADVSVIPHDAEAFARALYAELHRCDEAGAEWIAVEAPPDSAEWSGIADRLRRAAI